MTSAPNPPTTSAAPTAPTSEPQTAATGSGSRHPRRRWQQPPPGTPFHRLPAAGHRRQWPAALLTAVLALLTFLGLLYLSRFVVARLPDNGVPVLRAQTSTAVWYTAIAVITPVVVLLARAVEARPTGTLWSVTGRLRGGLLAYCTLAALLADGLIRIGLGQPWTVATWTGWSTFAGTAAAITVLVAFQATGEEVLYRGLLLQTAGRAIRNPLPAILAQALIFVYLHHPSGPWGFAAVLITGALLGYLTVLTGGLEAAIAFHLVNNVITEWLSIGFWHQPGLAPTDTNAGDIPPDHFLIHVARVVLVMAAIYAATLWRRPCAVTQTAP